jgi:methylmalonyl-CoA/ethylmalonyl-CoA epimerase
LKFDHVGIAVKSIDQVLTIYTRIGDFELRRTEVAGQKAKIAMLRAGETSVELLEPTSEDSSLAKFLREKGEGLHHIAFAVDDIEGAMKELSGQGFRFIYDKPAEGKFGSRVNFIHPKSAGGVLVELTQNTEE